MKKKILLTLIGLMSFSLVVAGAEEPILITISSDMDEVIFDGRWTYSKEWKHSSLDTISYDDSTVIQLRTAHQANFIYVFIDVISDTYPDKGSDRATICFDTKHDKTLVANVNDYCFMAVLARSEGFTFQGGSLIAVNGNFKKIANPEGFIGIGSISNENDRYTKIPHPSYEFRIPTEVVGRSNLYGFYIEVFDAHLNEIYRWPNSADTEKPLQISSPTKWGDLISPDNSLPEFSAPILALVPAFFVVLLTKFMKKNCN